RNISSKRTVWRKSGISWGRCSCGTSTSRPSPALIIATPATVSSGPTTTRARRMKPSARRSEQTCNRPARAQHTPRPDFPDGALCLLSRGGALVVARLELVANLILVQLAVDELTRSLACRRLLSQATRGDVRVRQFVGVPLHHRTAFFLVPVEARPRRDQLADEHVLLQADERVLL